MTSPSNRGEAASIPAHPTHKVETVRLASGLGRTLARDAGHSESDPIATAGQTLSAERIGWLHIGGITEVTVYQCKCNYLVHPEGECLRR